MALTSKVALIRNADGFDEVAARLKPSAAALWDLPSGSHVEVLDDWTECQFGKHHGFVKTKNLVGIEKLAPGAMVEVRDSYKGNSETCMRRHAEQDATTGNVLCYVPNGPAQVKLFDRWVEFRWKKHKGFVKARHVQPAPAGSEPDKAADAAVAAAAAARFTPAKRDAAAALIAGGAENKRARLGAGTGSASSGAAGSTDDVVMAGATTAAAASGAAVEASAAKVAAELASGAAETEPAAKPAAAADEPMPAAPATPAAPAPEAAAAAATAVEEPPVPPAAAAAAVVAEAPVTLAAAVAVAPEAPAPVAVAPVPATAAAAAPAAAGAEKTCDCCFDTVSATEGALCPAKEHFFCAGCLTGMLTAFKTAEVAEQRKGKGRVLCPMKDSDKPFSDAVLAAHVPEEVFMEYLEVRIKLAEKDIQDQMDKENSDKIADLKEKLAMATGSAEQVEIDKHRLHIIDDIFTLKCPRCKMAFLDYDDCSAVTCPGCKCGFCSYCLEDCGKNAHPHFFKNKSKCPKEGGPLFINHKAWLGYQVRRKSRVMGEYLATVPQALRKKVCDSVAPDAKDLGIEMPTYLTPEMLDPEAHGLVTMSLRVPRKLRILLAEQGKGLDKKGVYLEIPAKKAQVELVGEINEDEDDQTRVRKLPIADMKPKNISARLPVGKEVSIDDEWIECKCPDLGDIVGWVKARHIVGGCALESKVEVKDANGHGSTMIRKKCEQTEGKNLAGYLKDGAEVKVVQHWFEIKWEADIGLPGGKVKGGRGFVVRSQTREDDVRIKGKEDDVKAAVKELEKALNLPLAATKLGAPAAAKAKAKAKAAAAAAGRGRGKGRGRGRGG